MKTACSKCGADACCVWTVGVELCRACTAIEAHKLQRRMTLRELVGCEHVSTTWKLDAQQGRKRYWSRECLRCREIEHETTLRSSPDEENIDWMKKAMRKR